MNKLIPVDVFDEEHCKFLYKIVVERYRRSDVNISGRTPEVVPTYEQHVKYIRGSPYQFFYLYLMENILVGCIYLHYDGELSYFLVEGYHGRGIGPQMIRDFLAKIPGTVTSITNPDNVAVNKMLSKMGWSHAGNLWVSRF